MTELGWLCPYLNIFNSIYPVAGTLKGKYKPRNPKKYKGNPTNIIYRSSWERSFCKYCDLTEDVIQWQSEEKAVWYYDPCTKKKRRYFPDFIVQYKRKDGITMTEMIEIKPFKQVQGPNPHPKRRTKSWMYEVRTFVTNQAKWSAAREYCEDRGWNFRIITEKELGLTDK